MRQLGIFSWFGYRLPLAERLDLIVEAGFQATALWLGPAEELVAAGKADCMSLLARQAGLAIDSAHAPYSGCNDLWSTSTEARAAAVAQYQAALTYCGRHEIPVCVVHITEGSNPPPPNAGGLRAVEELVQGASDQGVVLAVENTSSPNHIDLVLSQVGSGNLGLCYDSSHDFMEGMTCGGLLQRWSHRLAAVHLSDTHGTEDDHALPGDGRVDWDALADWFPWEAFSGALMFEVYPRSADSMAARDFLRAAFQGALALRAKLG